MITYGELHKNWPYLDKPRTFLSSSVSATEKVMNAYNSVDIPYHIVLRTGSDSLTAVYNENGWEQTTGAFSTKGGS